MQGRLSVVTLTLMSMLATTSSTRAHHADSIYDKERLVTVTGDVVRFEFVNPHNVIYLDVRDGDGTSRRWIVYGAAPVALARVGWNQKIIQLGEQLTITGFQRKDGSRNMLHLRITRASGEPLPLGEAEQNYLRKFEQSGNELGHTSQQSR